MSGKVAVLLLVLATICAELPRSIAFQWSKVPNNEKKFTYQPGASFFFELKWTLSGSESVNQFQVKRYKEASELQTVKILSTYYANGQQTTESSYRLEVKKESNVPKEAVFTVINIDNQGNNLDGSPVNVMSANYTYSFVLSVIGASPGIKTSTLIVQKRPSISTEFENQYISSQRRVTLNCGADGIPTPNIKWDVIRTAGIQGENFYSTPEIVIESFGKKDTGVYNCSARNDAGTASATVILQYIACANSGCQSDETAIEFTTLTHSNDYENEQHTKYKDLKNAVEKECLTLYKNAQKKIFSCVVTGFRSGSVIANVKMTYETGLSEPRKPLEDAIKTGTFAGYAVNTNLVSPTTAPTQPPTPTDNLTPSTAAGGPDSGQRADGEGGLGTGAIAAIVVVFSIIFIVIIVVLIVCMLKRRKPAPRKQYKEDGKSKPAAAPLKPQPFRDPTYDNGPDDRYPNEGGPPPQYTPANYAEVRPSHAEQNESGMEWDKSVRNDEMWI